jgi:hypothetical protein
LLAAIPDDEPLDVADLPAYKEALEAKSTSPARRVTFHDLWDHPEAYRGQRVEVEARVARRFRQPAHGTFPALVEAWAWTPAGDLFCWEYPDTASAQLPINQTLRFTGTFLRRVRYQASDRERLAPLIVGNAQPVPLKSAGRSIVSPELGSQADWLIGSVAAGAVILVLALQHLRRPPRRMPHDLAPPPVFEPDPE